MDNQKWTIHRNWQHRVHKTKKNKAKTQYNIVAPSWEQHIIFVYWMMKMSALYKNVTINCVTIVLHH